MKKAFLTIFALLAALGLASAAYACEFCTLHQGGNFLEHNNYASLTYRSTVAATDANNNVFTPSADKLTINTLQFLTNYNFTGSLGVVLVVPQVSKSLEAPQGAVAGSSSGIGDIVTLGRYFLLKTPDTGKIALQAGIKWATGARFPAAGPMDTDLTLGTGSTDYLVGAAYSKAFGDFILTADLLYNIKNTGYDGYQFGNALNYNLYGAYRLNPDFYLMLSAFGESTAQDNDTLGLVTGIAGANPDTGGNVIYLAPGFQWVAGSWILEANYQTPISRSFNGMQMVVDNKWLASVKYLL